MTGPGAGCWALVPMKDSGRAKSRLATVLGPAERARVVALMLQDVLAALGGCDSIAGTLVVSRDAALREQARAQGAQAMAEGDGGGLRAALAAGARALAERGAGTVLVLAADLPLVAAADIEALLEAHGEAAGVSVAPDRAGRGTNALACTPPGAIAFQFGPDSCRRHLAAARAAGLPARRVERPNLALDIDTAADLQALLAGGARGAAGEWLRASPAAQRLRHGVSPAVA